MERKDINEMMQERVNTYSSPSNLKITDMRVANIDGAPKHCPLIKIYTNQGIVGFGEVRDASSATYALMLKSRLLGENPLNVDKLFRRIKQLGGKFRDKVRMYCDTDVDGKHTGTDMGHALKKRMEKGFTFLKMDLGIELMLDEPGCLNAPLGFLEDIKKYSIRPLTIKKVL